MILIEVVQSIEEVGSVIEVLLQSEGDRAGLSRALLFVVLDLILLYTRVEDVYHDTEDNEDHTYDEEQVFRALHSRLRMPLLQEQHLPASTLRRLTSRSTCASLFTLTALLHSK